jgi:hypothetical protein
LRGLLEQKSSVAARTAKGFIPFSPVFKMGTLTMEHALDAMVADVQLTAR